MDLASLYRVTENFAAYLSEVTDGDLARSTPCESWDLDDLFRHLVQQNIAVGRAVDARSPLPAAPGACTPLETIYRDSARYASEALASAVEAAEEPEHSPACGTFGNLSVAQILRLHLANTLIHTWDLAQAIGFELPDAYR